MQLRRWFLVSCVGLSFNVLFILGVLVMRDVGAQEGGLGQTAAEGSNERARGATTVADTDVPSVPSLGANRGLSLGANSENENSDPILDEMRKIIQEETPRMNVPSLSETLEIPNLGDDELIEYEAHYFQRLERRLESVEQLNSAARKLVAEAGELAAEEQYFESRELLEMSLRLREMAAELLVREL